MRPSSLVLLAAFAALAAIAQAADAGVVVHEDDGKKVVIGGRVQVQYLRIDPKEGEASDRIFFRRLRPYIEGTVSENWIGKVQVDFGQSLDENEVSVKDAYGLYTGWSNHKFYVGNSKTPFAREYLTSSKRLQMVERSFTGDHNFGNPDRQLGLQLSGKASGGKVTYAGAVGGQHHDPNVRSMDFDTPANNIEDWNEGLVYAARIDFHPNGNVAFAQGDFGKERAAKYVFGVSAFGWQNDGDNNTYTAADSSLNDSKADLDQAYGWEVSGALRGAGASVDASYQQVDGETVVRSFTGGIYLDGKTNMTKTSVTGGFMAIRNQLEIAAAFSSLNTDAYAKRWDNIAFSVNYFWNKHKVKVQTMYELSKNSFGVDGDDADITRLQFQHVF